MSVEEEIELLHSDRLRKEHHERASKQANGEYIYLDFCVWCNANGRRNDKNNAKVFGAWLKEKKLELTFWQRKHLAEKYFGYKYEYKNDKGDWEVKKV